MVRVGFRILDVVRHLVQIGVEELVERPAAELAIVRIDSHELTRLVVAPQDARGRPDVDLEFVVGLAAIDLREPVAKERSEGRDRRLEPPRRRRDRRAPQRLRGKNRVRRSDAPQSAGPARPGARRRTGAGRSVGGRHWDGRASIARTFDVPCAGSGRIVLPPRLQKSAGAVRSGQYVARPPLIS